MSSCSPRASASACPSASASGRGCLTAPDGLGRRGRSCGLPVPLPPAQDSSPVFVQGTADPQDDPSDDVAPTGSQPVWRRAWPRTRLTNLLIRHGPPDLDLHSTRKVSRCAQEVRVARKDVAKDVEYKDATTSLDVVTSRRNYAALLNNAGGPRLAVEITHPHQRGSEPRRAEKTAGTRRGGRPGSR